jgi:hypothetical protein
MNVKKKGFKKWKNLWGIERADFCDLREFSHLTLTLSTY